MTEPSRWADRDIGQKVSIVILAILAIVIGLGFIADVLDKAVNRGRANDWIALAIVALFALIFVAISWRKRK